MKKSILVVGIILLAGAGCVPPEEPGDAPASQNTPAAAIESVTTPPANTRQPPATSQPVVNRQNQAATTPAQNQTAPSTNNTAAPENTAADSDERGVFVDDEHCRNFFNYDHTDADLLVVCKKHGVYADRMGTAIIKASPAGSDYYDKASWVPEDPEGKRMLDAGEASGEAILRSHFAFEKNSPTASLVAKADSFTKNWLETIIAFEVKWGVSP